MTLFFTISLIMEQQNKQYSLFFAIILGINAIIGAGVFAMPINLFRQAGPASLITIGFAAFCVLCIGLAFARIAFLIPEQGSFYTYVTAWSNKTVGAISSFSYIAGLSVALGLLCRYVSNIIAIYMTGVESHYIGYCVIVGIFIATLFASSLARVGQIILFLLTIIPLIVIGWLCAKGFSLHRFENFWSYGIKGIMQGVPSVLFSFLGFESIASMARVVRDPRKNIPIATILVIIISTIVYFCFVGIVIGSIDHQLLLSKSTLSQLLLYEFQDLQWIVHFINIAMIITILGTIYAMSIALTELFRSIVFKISNQKILVPETVTILGLSLIMVFSMKAFSDISRMFNWICLCIALSYFLVSMYLIVKPRNISDFILGLFSILATCIFMGAGIIQLI
jgi:amino acid transporter